MTNQQLLIASKCDAILHEKLGFCNCCGHVVPLLKDEKLGESVCKICRSYDVKPRKH